MKIGESSKHLPWGVIYSYSPPPGGIDANGGMSTGLTNPVSRGLEEDQCVTWMLSSRDGRAVDVRGSWSGTGDIDGLDRLGQKRQVAAWDGQANPESRGWSNRDRMCVVKVVRSGR